MSHAISLHDGEGKPVTLKSPLPIVQGVEKVYAATARELITVSATAITLTVPGGVAKALVFVNAGEGRAFWDGGAAPTGTVGVYLKKGDVITLENTLDMNNFSIIKDTNSVTDVEVVVLYSTLQ